MNQAPAFDFATVKLVASYETPGTLYTVCLDEDERTLYGAGSEGTLFTVNLTAEKPSAQKGETLHENYVSASRRIGDRLITGSYDRTLAWFDLKERKRLRVVPAHEGWVRKVEMTSDGQLIASAGDDMLVNLWDAQGRKIASLAGHAKQTPEGFLSALYALAISPDGKFLAGGDRAGFLRIWDLSTRKMISGFRSPELYTFDPQKRARAIGGIRGLAFSADGKQLAVSGIGPVTNVDGFVGPARFELWDWQTNKRTASIECKHQAILNQVAYGPRSPWLIGAGGGDGGGALCFWDPTGTAPPHVAKPKGHLQSFVVNRAGNRLFAGGHGGFQVWSPG